MRWPALTLLGITCAALIGIVYRLALSLRVELRSCLLGYDDLLPKDFADGFGTDGYGPS